MKNKKGFTLIELLAVIVILAIIALIATPIILNMIENAKKGAAKDSAYGYIEAIEYNNSIADLGMNNSYTKIPDGVDLDVTTLDVKVKGSKPDSGIVTITKGNVTNAELCINNYNVTYDGQTAEVEGKCGESESEEPVVTETPAECFIFSNGIITGYTVSDKCTTDVVIPSSINGIEVIGIGNTAFAGKNLTSVIIPNSVTSIGNNAYASNKLTNVIIPNSVTSMGNGAFSSNSITSVTISNSLKTISAGAFASNKLTNVIIPNSVTLIQGSSFQNNEITSVTIPNSVTEIQGSAFINNKIKNLVIPGSVKLIRIHAFEANEIENLTLENGIETIESYSFQNNKITTLTFPSSLTTIYASSFSSNPNLTTIYNKTGKSFNFGAIVGGAPASLETGTITVDNGQVITITK